MQAMVRGIGSKRPVILLVLVTLVLSVGPLSAQGLPAGDVYKKKRVSAEYASADRSQKLRDTQSLREHLLGRKTFAKATGYLRDYRIAQMTQFDEATLAELPEFRRKFLKETVLLVGITEARHQEVVDLAFNELKVIAVENYHPAVKYNAISLIGDLHQTEGQKNGSTRSAPVPYQPATDFLISLLQSPSSSEADKIAALRGIWTHSMYHHTLEAKDQIPSATVQAISTEMTKILDSQPASEISQSVHEWKQRRAISTLAAIGETGGGNAVFNRLRNLMNDKNSSLPIRLEALEGVVKLRPSGLADAEVEKVAQEIATVGVEICFSAVSESRKKLDIAALHGKKEAKVVTRRNSGGGGGDKGGDVGGAAGAAGSGGGRGARQAAGTNRAGGDTSGQVPVSDLGVFEVENVKLFLRTNITVIHTNLKGTKRKAGGIHEWEGQSHKAYVSQLTENFVSILELTEDANADFLSIEMFTDEVESRLTPLARSLGLPLPQPRQGSDKTLVGGG
ncbi:MAG: hypothetical protein MPJ24_05720 [Pirellulaceae bacterium]|nr:hypothetical protein [Pirellulaceae bacterium]